MDPKASAVPETQSPSVPSQPVYEAPPQSVAPPQQPPQPMSEPEPQPAATDTFVVPPDASGVHAYTPPSDVPPPPSSGDAAPSVPPPNPLPRRLLIVGVGLILLLGLVFGIRALFSGGGGGKSAGGNVPAPTKRVTITYWGLWENDTVTRQFLADFQAKYPNITVQYTQESPQQYRERLQSAITRGEGPDVFRFHNTWIPMLRQQLATVPPTVMSVAEFSNTFFPVAVNNLVAGDRIFGIPLMIDGLGLYINDDLFASAGVSAPTTWTDLSNIVPKLTAKDGSSIITSAIALGTASNVEHYSDILGLLFYQNGANLATITGPEAEQTLTFYRQFADPSSTLYTWNDGMDNSVSAFASGRVAMILAPSWRAHDIIRINPKLHFRIVPVPQLQGNSVAWASYWVEGVSSSSKNPDAAWTFVKYLTSKEGASKLYTEESKARTFGEPYARTDLANSIQNDPYTGAYVKQAVFARSFPLASRTFDNGLNDRLIQYLTDAVNSMASGAAPQQVLKTASAGFRQVLSSYGLATSDVTPTP